MLLNLFAERHCRQAISGIRSLEKILPSPHSRFAIPFVFRGKGIFRTIEPRQNPVEIERCFHAICKLRPRLVLEIGTAEGGSLYLWTQAAEDDAKILSVDLPGGDFGGAYPECRVRLYRAFARRGQTVELIRADSHASDTRERVREFFENTSLDFLFIDGDHSYEGVKADFEQYGSLVRQGGLIGFHDIMPRADCPDIQVNRLWRKLEVKYECQAIVAPDGGGRRIGIGLLRVPEGGI